MLHHQQQPDFTPGAVRHHVVRILCVSLAVGLLCFVFFGYGTAAKSSLKHIWSRWDVHRAGPLLQDESTAMRGILLLRNALVRTPDEPEVMRALAEVTASSGLLVHAHFFYQHLSLAGAMTPSDKLRHATVRAGLNDHVGAQIVLQQFARAEGQSTPFWHAQAQVAAARGDHAIARDALTKVLTAVPHDPVARLELAKTQTFAPEASSQQTGVTQLLDLFEESLHKLDPTQRTQCFWALSTTPVMDDSQRARFTRLLQDIPWKPTERRVVQRFVEWSMDAQDRDRIHLRAWLHDLFLKRAPASSLDERLAIARTLQRHGEHALVLEWITVPHAVRDVLLCTTRLDSLFAMQRWQPAIDLIKSSESPLPPVLRAIMRAQVELLSTSGKSAHADELLRQAILTARDGSGSQSAFTAIARLAADYGRHRMAFEAYAEALAPRYPLAQFLVSAYLQQARLCGATAREALACLDQRHDHEHWNQEWLYQLSYYRILCGEKIELVEAEALENRRLSPADPHSAFLVAFARLRFQETTSLRSYLPLLTSSQSWTPGEHVVLHAIHLAAGDHTTAAAIRRTIPSDVPLFPEEKHLLAPAR